MDLRATWLPWVRPRDCLNSMFVSCFTCIWATPGYHKWCRGFVTIQCLYRVLHACERRQGTISEARDCLSSLLVLTFCTQSRGRGIVSSQCLYCVLHSFERPGYHECLVFVLCCERNWATPGYHKWGRVIVSTRCLYCVYMQSSDTRAPQVRLRDCLNSMFVVNSIFVSCVTRIWATPGYHKWGRGIVSTQCLSCVLHLFGRYHTWGQGIVSIQCLHCVAHTWVIPGYHKWGQGIVSAQCLHWVLHAFEWHLGTINEAEGLVSTQSLYGVRHAFDRHQETIGEVQGPGRVAAPWACHPPSLRFQRISWWFRVLTVYSPRTPRAS